MKSQPLNRYHKLLKRFFSHTFTLVEKLEIELLLVIVIVWFGSYYFSILEGRSYFDSLYFSVISITSLGYGDISPQTVWGKIIAMVYAVVGLPLFLVASSFIVQILTTSQTKARQKRKTERENE